MASEAANLHTQGPWECGARKDGSIWISLGDPITGTHYQFDWYAPEHDARLAMAAPDMYETLTRIEGMIDRIPEAQRLAAEDRILEWARAALAKVQP
jgi:hypothetical protein